jgi:hypothetical protein
MDLSKLRTIRVILCVLLPVSFISLCLFRFVIISCTTHDNKITQVLIWMLCRWKAPQTSNSYFVLGNLPPGCLCSLSVPTLLCLLIALLLHYISKWTRIVNDAVCFCRYVIILTDNYRLSFAAATPPHWWADAEWAGLTRQTRWLEVATANCRIKYCHYAILLLCPTRGLLVDVR